MFFMASTRRAVEFLSRLPNLVAQDCGLFKIFVADGLLQILLQPIQLFHVILVLLQLLRDFADMFGPFVHRLEQTFQSLGERGVTIRATQAAGLFEISLGEAAGGTSQV